MNGSTHLSAWVTLETKQRFAAMAQHAGLSESALLKRMVELTIQGTQAPDAVPVGATGKVNRDSRLYVRLRPEDHLLLRERAVGRGMAAATYVSMLVRTHLRGMAPIPDQELSELRHSVALLGCSGRSHVTCTLSRALLLRWCRPVRQPSRISMLYYARARRCGRIQRC